MKLTEEASKHTTFWSPKGRFRWTKLPFGISTARIHENLEGLNGIVAIANDVLVFGKGDTMEQAKINHDKNLKALLERSQQRGNEI